MPRTKVFAITCSEMRRRDGEEHDEEEQRDARRRVVGFVQTGESMIWSSERARVLVMLIIRLSFWPRRG